MIREISNIASLLGHSSATFINKGSQGWVFSIEDSRILKISIGLEEAAIATVIKTAADKGNGHPGLPEIHDIREVEVAERGLLSAVVREHLADFPDNRDTVRTLGQLLEEAYRFGGPSPDEQAFIDDHVTSHDLFRYHHDLSQIIEWGLRQDLVLYDVSAENWSIRPVDGTLVLRDFGRSKTFPQWIIDLTDSGGLPKAFISSDFADCTFST